MASRTAKGANPDPDVAVGNSQKTAVGADQDDAKVQSPSLAGADQEPDQVPVTSTDQLVAAADAAVAGLSYEQARDELVSVVAKLESGGESLADSMALFQRGEALVRLCEEQLTAARQVITGAPTPDQARSN